MRPSGLIFDISLEYYMHVCLCKLTVADKFLLLHVWDIQASHVGGGHALGEGSQAPPGSEPVREPRQVTVTVEVVGVQTPETDEERDESLCAKPFSGLFTFCRQKLNPVTSAE